MRQKRKIAKADMVQLTVRLKKQQLREIQHYLNMQDTSMAKFVGQKVEEFIMDYRQQHPEHVPGGLHAIAQS